MASVTGLRSLVVVLAVAGALVPALANPGAAQEVPCPEALGDLVLSAADLTEDGDGNPLARCTYAAADDTVSTVRLNTVWTAPDTVSVEPADCGFTRDPLLEETGKLTGWRYSATRAANARYVVVDANLVHDRAAIDEAVDAMLSSAEAVAVECAVATATPAAAPAEEDPGEAGVEERLLIVALVAVGVAALFGYLTYVRRRNLAVIGSDPSGFE